MWSRCSSTQWVVSTSGQPRSPRTRLANRPRKKSTIACINYEAIWERLGSPLASWLPIIRNIRLASPHGGDPVGTAAKTRTRPREEYAVGPRSERDCCRVATHQMSIGNLYCDHNWHTFRYGKRAHDVQGDFVRKESFRNRILSFRIRTLSGGS
jgi:hypothetical protein